MLDVLFAGVTRACISIGAWNDSLTQAADRMYRALFQETGLLVGLLLGFQACEDWRQVGPFSIQTARPTESNQVRSFPNRFRKLHAEWTPSPEELHAGHAFSPNERANHLLDRPQQGLPAAAPAELEGSNS